MDTVTEIVEMTSGCIELVFLSGLSTFRLSPLYLIGYDVPKDKVQNVSSSSKIFQGEKVIMVGPLSKESLMPHL